MKNNPVFIAPQHLVVHAYGHKVACSAEPVEKPFSIVNGCFLGGFMIPHNCEIVDCGAFCEVTFFCLSSKNLLGDFFDRLAIFLSVS